MCLWSGRTTVVILSSDNVLLTKKIKRKFTSLLSTEDYLFTAPFFVFFFCLFVFFCFLYDLCMPELATRKKHVGTRIFAPGTSAKETWSQLKLMDGRSWYLTASGGDRKYLLVSPDQKPGRYRLPSQTHSAELQSTDHTPKHPFSCSGYGRDCHSRTGLYITGSDVPSQAEQQPPRRSPMISRDRRMPTILINN